MSPRITEDVLDAFLHCRYKGYLKQAGQVGVRSDYEVLAAEQQVDVRQLAVERVAARHAASDVIRTVPLTTPTLKRGPPSSSTRPWRTAPSRCGSTG